VRRSTVLGVLLAVAMGAAAPVGPTTAAAAPRTGSDRFLAGAPYTGTFADPTILRVGRSYVVASTTTANVNLPVMTSTDLTTWTPPTSDDALGRPPAWAAVKGRRDQVPLISQWAPSLAKVGSHYVAAFSAAISLVPRTSCIGVATSADPLGPYAAASAKPLVCFRKSPLGAIDPDILVDRGTPYLLWKNEGVPDVSPPRIMVRQLDATGTRFAPGSRKVALIERDQAWEGDVVENPSMVRYRGRYVLLYSGNGWRTASYATGYAICDSPLGPCRKAPAPILASTATESGPGGADAFVDRGTLRAVYHAYDPGVVGEGRPRRLHVAQLALSGRGVLRALGPR
jgi:beta-xylosidase